MVNNQGVRDDCINGSAGTADLGLPHTIANDLTAAKLHLVTIGREVPFDFNYQFRICQTNTVAGGRPIHIRIGGTGNFKCHDYSPTTLL